MESQTDSGPKFLNSNDWLSIIFHNSQDLIWCINLDFALVFGNEAFQNHTELFTGYRLKPGESVFHYLKDSEVKSEWEGYYRQVINEGKTLQIDIRTRKLPQTRYINYTLAPVLNNAVEIMGVSVIGRDVTQYKKCSEEALKANELLKLTEKLVLSGSWEYFPEDGTLNWSEQVYALHDLQPEDFEGHTQDLLYASVQCYRPEDRPRLLEAFDRCLSEGLPYDLEFSFQTQKGKPIWVRTIGVPEIKNGKVVKVKGIVKDITLQKNKDSALRSSEMKFRQLVEQAAEMLFLHDMKGNIVDVNKASVQQIGRASCRERV